MNETEFTMEPFRPLVDSRLLSDYPSAIRNKEHHAKVLAYFLSRVDRRRTSLTTRRKRYSYVDVVVSTWRTLSQEDSKRQTANMRKGSAIPVAANLPLIHTHIEDMVAFYVNVLMPHGQGFQQVPANVEESEGLNALIDLLNIDARKSKQRKQLAASLRALTKYNAGGFHLYWQDSFDQGTSKGNNIVESIDMYNFVWDGAVSDPADIPKDAEWAAVFEMHNALWFSRQEEMNLITGSARVLPRLKQQEVVEKAHTARYYRDPPTVSGVRPQDSLTGSGEYPEMDWAGYGAGLESEEVRYDGYEVIRMYCWATPRQLDLKGYARDELDSINLFHVVIAGGGTEILALDDISRSLRDGSMTEIPEIPFYLGYLNQDDLGEAQRSPAEQMIPFQNFASFLMNAHVMGTRGNIVGWLFYDPLYVSLNDVSPEEGAGRVPIRGLAGKDIRSVIQQFNSKYDTSNTIESIQFVRQMMNDYHPARALPAQLAGIDRAVKNQVSSIIHTANLRSQLLVQTLDADIMQPLIMAMWRNHVLHGGYSSTIPDDVLLNKLGSGIKQLNREAAEMNFRELLFMFIQNPDAAQPNSPIRNMMRYWGALQGSDTDLATLFGPEQEAQDGSTESNPAGPGGPDDLGGVAAPLQ